MCGIAGICVSRPTASIETTLEAMTGRLTHRGPDEEGRYVRPTVALGSRRLKVIDLETGRMPMGNEDGTVQVVYNGEIYNYRAIREELRRQGHTFRTNSDTEVLVHLYEQYGADLVTRLRGMFAFALWDEKAETLLLARDRLGIKPLYYRVQDGTLWFASELKGLVAAAPHHPEIDPEALAEYLALGYIRAPRTIYRGYRKLPPGTLLHWRAGAARLERYWSVPTGGAPEVSSLDEAVDAIEAHVRRAVTERLVADVPLGAFLSGGVDSSLVVALAAQASPGRLKTFSVADGTYNELPYARRVAERYDTEHHELVLRPDSCRIAAQLLDFFDEPFGDSSAIPTYYVSQLARRHVTVALSGDGGDELFAGYEQYRHDARWAWLDAVPLGVRRAVFGSLARRLPPGAYGRNFLRALAATREGRFTLFRAEDLDPALGGLLSPRLADLAPTPDAVFADEFRAAGTLPFPARLQYVDATTYLPDDILAKVDRMSMAHSLEARVPLLDHLLVEFAMRLPGRWTMRHGESKRILKLVAQRHVPREVLYRPKRGFSLPLHTWLRGELADLLEMLLRPDALVHQYVHAPTVRRLVAEHRAARRNHVTVLWRLVMLEYWLRGRRGQDTRVAPSRVAASRLRPSAGPVAR